MTVDSYVLDGMAYVNTFVASVYLICCLRKP